MTSKEFFLVGPVGPDNESNRIREQNPSPKEPTNGTCVNAIEMSPPSSHSTNTNGPSPSKKQGIAPKDVTNKDDSESWSYDDLHGESHITRLVRNSTPLDSPDAGTSKAKHGKGKAPAACVDFGSSEERDHPIYSSYGYMAPGTEAIEAMRTATHYHSEEEINKDLTFLYCFQFAPDAELAVQLLRRQIVSKLRLNGINVSPELEFGHYAGPQGPFNDADGAHAGDSDGSLWSISSGSLRSAQAAQVPSVPVQQYTIGGSGKIHCSVPGNKPQELPSLAQSACAQEDDSIETEFFPGTAGSNSTQSYGHQLLAAGYNIVQAGQTSDQAASHGKTADVYVPPWRRNALPSCSGLPALTGGNSLGRIVPQSQPHHQQQFAPMDSISTRLSSLAVSSSSLTSSKGLGALPSHVRDLVHASEFSENYKGNKSLARNQSARIAESENCSTWITNLPPMVTVHDLLAAIRGTGGRVYATVVNPPNPATGHVTAAAKVVFFERAAAERLCEIARGRSGLVIGGMQARVSYNRIKSAEDLHPHRSRVLLLKGSPAFVNERALKAYFNSKFMYEIDEVISWMDGTAPGGLSIVEFRFGSYRCQAEAAKIALAREMPQVDVSFGPDPCT